MWNIVWCFYAIIMVCHLIRFKNQLDRIETGIASIRYYMYIQAMRDFPRVSHRDNKRNPN